MSVGRLVEESLAVLVRPSTMLCLRHSRDSVAPHLKTSLSSRAPISRLGYRLTPTSPALIAAVGCPAEIGTDYDSQVFELVHWFEETLWCWVLVDLVDKWKFTRVFVFEATWHTYSNLSLWTLWSCILFLDDHSVTVSRSAWRIAISASQEIALEI